MDQKVSQFADRCRDLCKWIEHPSGDPKAINELMRLLASVYCLAFELPEMEATGSVAEGSVSKEQSDQIYKGLACLPVGYYSEILDLFELDKQDVGIGDLAADLRDIYIDLQNGIALLESGRVNDAVWTFKFGLGAHWGSHLTSALKILHESMEPSLIGKGHILLDARFER